MRIDILTLFPEMFDSVFSASMIARAAEKGIIDIHTYNIRDYTDNKHRKTDDYPFGGGNGLVMMAQPIFDCMKHVEEEYFCDKCCRILLTPRGKALNTGLARKLSCYDRLILLCGHYEGVDERVNQIIDEEISVGDFILTGGEIPAMALVDCVSRFIPGVLGNPECAENESFGDFLLEYPQYTRPADFRGLKVPEVLLNGNHKEIEAWRKEEAVKKTRKNRNDLYRKYRRKLQKV